MVGIEQRALHDIAHDFAISPVSPSAAAPARDAALRQSATRTGFPARQARPFRAPLE